MTAFQILEMKHFMAKLLTEDCFDSFLLEKASVSCAVSYEIDGRVNPEFYQDDETPDAGYLFLPWKSIRPVLFQMIRGKHTPLSFKFVLHLMPQYVPGVMKGADPSLKPEQVQALVLTIKYDGSAIRLTTGTAFSSFGSALISSLFTVSGLSGVSTVTNGVSCFFTGKPCEIISFIKSSSICGFPPLCFAISL